MKRVVLAGLALALFAGPAQAGWKIQKSIGTDVAHETVRAVSADTKGKRTFIVACSGQAPAIGVAFDFPKVELSTEVMATLTVDGTATYGMKMTQTGGGSGYEWVPEQADKWNEIAHALMQARRSIVLELDFSRLGDETLTIPAFGSYKAIAPVVKRCSADTVAEDEAPAAPIKPGWTARVQ